MFYNGDVERFSRQRLEMTMKEPGLDDRHRDKDGTIERKHGNTLVRTLRETYGDGFAPGVREDKTLDNLLRDAGVDSLSEYLKLGR
jgi:hypothetical protein